MNRTDERTKNGGDVEGGCCEREFQEESDEGTVRVCWSRITNGRRTVNEKSGCAQSGGYN